MRRLVLAATIAATLLLGAVVPAFAAHGGTGCPIATSKAASQGAAWVAVACSRGQ